MGNGRRVAKDVAGIGVGRDQSKSLAFATSTDQDARPRRTDRQRGTQRLGQVVVRALVGAVVVAPHLFANLQRLLEPLKALRHGRKRNTQPQVLAFVPGSTDAEFRSSTRQHVQGRYRLGQQPGVTVGHSADEQAQTQVLSLCRDVSQRRIAL